MAEIWKPVKDWPGYEVSNHGRVRSFKKRSKGRKWVVDMAIQPTILRPDIRNNYPSIVLCDKKRGRKWASIHRLVLETFHRSAQSNEQAAHGDGDTSNNHISNLRWATAAENSADKKKHGTWQCGERIGSAKLSNLQAQEIRRLRRGGASNKKLSKRFRVCPNTITNITSGKTYKDDIYGTK